MAKSFSRTQVLQNRVFPLRPPPHRECAARLPRGGAQIFDDAGPAAQASGVRGAVGCDAGVCAGAVRRAEGEGLGEGSLAPPPAIRRSPSPTRAGGGYFRTAGGEAVVVRLKSGKLQVRRAQAGKLTPAAEQAFLAAVSATCNLALAAAAVGAASTRSTGGGGRTRGSLGRCGWRFSAAMSALELAVLESGAAGQPRAGRLAPQRAAGDAADERQPGAAADVSPPEGGAADRPSRTPMRRRRGESREAPATSGWRRWPRSATGARARRSRWRKRSGGGAGEPAWGPAGEAVRAAGAGG